MSLTLASGLSEANGILEHRLDQPSARLAIHVEDALALDGDVAGGRRQQAEDQARQGRLAAARFAHHAQHAAGRYGEGHVIDGDHVPVGPPQTALDAKGLPRGADFDGRRAHGRRHRNSCVAPALVARNSVKAGLVGEVAAFAEGAAFEARRDARHGAGDRAQRLLAPDLARHRHTAQQALRVGVLGIGEQVGGVGALHHFARIHHRDLGGDARHDAEIVGDQQQAEPEVALQAGEQAQDLGLHRDVERGGRLVGDQELRIAHQRHGDHHPLAQAARELVRELAEPETGRGDADAGQQVGGAVGGGALAGTLVAAQHLGHLRADRVGGIERGHRLLEDHRHGIAAQLRHAGVRELLEILALKGEALGAAAAAARQEVHHRECRD